MTDAMLGWVIIGGLVLLGMLFKRRKPPQRSPGMIFVEVVEIFEVSKRPKKAAGFLVNVAILAVVIGFFLVVGR
jgi:hypothetical protein